MGSVAVAAPHSRLPPKSPRNGLIRGRIGLSRGFVPQSRALWRNGDNPSETSMAQWGPSEWIKPVQRIPNRRLRGIDVSASRRFGDRSPAGLKRDLPAADDQRERGRGRMDRTSCRSRSFKMSKNPPAVCLCREAASETDDRKPQIARRTHPAGAGRKGHYLRISE
jgi:hypothetical protein